MSLIDWSNEDALWLVAGANGATHTATKNGVGCQLPPFEA